MRINRYIAAATGMSRRAADKLIAGRKVFINNIPASLGDHATSNDVVTLNKERLFFPFETISAIGAGKVQSRTFFGSSFPVIKPNDSNFTVG